MPNMQPTNHCQRNYFPVDLKSEKEVNMPNTSQKPDSKLCVMLLRTTILGLLAQNTYKHGIPGGKIEHVLSHMKVYDLNQFSSVIVYVGGNDAANGTDPELFEEKYDQLIHHKSVSNLQL